MPVQTDLLLVVNFSRILTCLHNHHQNFLIVWFHLLIQSLRQIHYLSHTQFLLDLILRLLIQGLRQIHCQLHTQFLLHLILHLLVYFYILLLLLLDNICKLMQSQNYELELHAVLSSQVSQLYMHMLYSYRHEVLMGVAMVSLRKKVIKVFLCCALSRSQHPNDKLML